MRTKGTDSVRTVTFFGTRKRGGGLQSIPAGGEGA